MPVPPPPFTKVCIINCASWPWWRWCGGAALLGRAVLRYYLIPRPVLDIDNARGVLAAAVLRYPILRKTSHCIGVTHHIHNCHIVTLVTHSSCSGGGGAEVVVSQEAAVACCLGLGLEDRRHLHPPHRSKLQAQQFSTLINRKTLSS